MSPSYRFSKEAMIMAGKKKVAMDITEDTAARIDTIRKLRPDLQSNGAVVDCLASITDYDSEILREIAEVFTRHQREVHEQIGRLPQSAVFRRADLDEFASRLRDSAALFEALSYERPINPETELEPIKSIKMNGKVLKIPQNDRWIVANEADASIYDEAVIMEITDPNEPNPPHFILFTDEYSVRKKLWATAHQTIKMKCPEFEPYADISIRNEPDDERGSIGFYPVRMAPQKNPYGIELTPSS